MKFCMTLHSFFAKEDHMEIIYAVRPSEATLTLPTGTLVIMVGPDQSVLQQKLVEGFMEIATPEQLDYMNDILKYVTVLHGGELDS